MKNIWPVCSFICLTLVFLFIPAGLMAQSEYENPWGITVPTQTSNLAYERYPVEGFAWPTSALPGQAIKFYISVKDLLPQSPDGQTYEMKIFRSPNANTVVHSFANAVGRFYPLHDSTGAPIFPGDTTGRKPVDYKLGCMNQWDSTSVSFTIPSDWPSGFYYARLNHLSLNVPNEYYYIPFIVRSPHPGDSTKILFKLDFNTWHAYNYWGGGSLYSLTQDPVTLTSDSVIAIDRPLRRDISQWCPGFAASLERVLRDSGYAMEYCSSVDVDSLPSSPNEIIGLNLLRRYQMLILWGHDEYWSPDERTNTESFIGKFNSGLHGNIARFTANTCYWLIRWIGTGSKYLRLQCRKNNYPSGYHPAYDLWRLDDPSTSRTGNPEAKFLGSQYERGWNNIDGDPLTEEPADKVYKPTHWIFRNANLDSIGQEFGLGTMNFGRQRGIVAIEVDNTTDMGNTYEFGFPLDTLAQRTVYSNLGDTLHGYVLHQMTYYEDTVSNARMFAQGAIGWYNGLDGTIDPNDITRMKTITINIVSHFSGKKYIGKVYTRPQFPLVWNDNINIDGDVEILAGKYLITANNTITIDTLYGCYTYGTLELNGAVNVTGRYNAYAELYIGNGGKLLVKAGATLNVNPAINLILAAGSTVELEQGATIRINNGGLMELLGNVTWSFGTDSKIEVSGSVQVANNTTLTIPSGGQLLVNGGSEFQFGDAAQLIAYGPLTAIGTGLQPIAFGRLSTASNWLGIHIESGLAVSELRHCVITDAITGVSVNYSRFKLKESAISNCSVGIDVSGYHPKLYYQLDTNTVQNCWTSGIVINNADNVTMHDNIISGCTSGLVTTQATSRLYRNVIENSAEEGVFAGEYSNPRFGDVLLADPGNNVIRNSAISALHAVNSTPFLGSGCERVYGGWNSVYGDALLVNAEKGAYVSANWNWWGIDPPKAEQFTSDGESWIDYDCWMSYDPNEGMRPSGSPTLTLGGKGGDDPPPILSITPERAKLLQALSLRGQGDYRRALGVYANLIRMSPNAPEARVALSELRNTFHDFILSSNDSTLQGALEDSLRTHRINHPNALLRRLAMALVAAEITNRRDFAAAIAEYNQLLQSSTDIERAIYLFALFNINSQGIRDRSEAQRYLTQLQTLYPTDIRTRIASARFASMIDAQGSNGMQKPLVAGGLESMTSAPKEFALLQNYPNPFNPSTTIKYNLPIDAHVTLKLYDVLGRKVLTLVDEQAKGGYHSVTLDGSSLSSGVYFYRMQAGAFAQTKKLLLLR